MTDIFISYVREDEARIVELVEALEGQGWLIFWDRRIPAGKTWQSYIGQALNEAKCVVVAWSHLSVTSDWVIEEANEAKDRGILVPVLLESVKPPLGFRGIQAADLTKWKLGTSSPQFDQMIQDIMGVVGGKPPQAAPEVKLTPGTQPVATPGAIPEEIDRKLNLAEELSKAEREERAFDVYRNVLKLDPINLRAQEGMKNLIKNTKEKLGDYQTSDQEKIETDIYKQAHFILAIPYLSLSDMQKEYMRLIMCLLRGLDMGTFETDWKRIERKEQDLLLQEKDKLKQMSKERVLRGMEQSRKIEIDKPPAPQYSTTAKVESKPVTSEQPLSVNLQRAIKTAQVFISYAHKDETWLEQLKMMLSPLIDDKTINVWDDSKIEPGDQWLPEIEKSLNEADIALLLVSKEFLNSDFIKKKEIPPLIEAAKSRGVRFLWILVSDCRWDRVQALESRQATHSTEKPLDSLSGSELNKVLKNISIEIERAAQRVVAQRTNP